MHIQNSADLNNYYQNTVENEVKEPKSNKTRLIIVKDKDGSEHLEARKLSLTERIGAFCGGKASLSRVVEFCNQKNMNCEALVKLVDSYNDQHKGKISYSYMIHGTSATKTEPSIMGVANLDTAIERAFDKQDLEPLNNFLVSKFPNDPDVMKKLIDYFKQAVKKGHKDVATVLVKRLDLKDVKDMLLSACTNGDLETAKAICSGRDDNVLYNKAQAADTPLINAVRENKLEVVEVLLSTAVVDPTVKPYTGDALQAANSDKHIEVAKALLNHPKMSISPERFVFLLNESIKNGSTEITKALCSSKFASQVNEHADTPLISACKDKNISLSERKAVVKLLLENTGDTIFHENSNHLDALSYTTELLDVFTEFASSRAPLADKMKDKLQLKQLKELATTSSQETKGKKINDLKSLPKIDRMDLQNAFNAVLAQKDGPSSIKTLTQYERAAILFDLVRSSRVITPQEADLLVKGLTKGQVASSLSWLNNQLSKLNPISLDKQTLKVSSEQIILLGKTLMKACADSPKSTEYDQLERMYKDFKP